jgi:excisionase family DNA binding protein
MTHTSLLSPAQAGDRVGVHAETIRRWIRQGRIIPARRSQTGRILVDWADVARVAGLDPEHDE